MLDVVLDVVGFEDRRLGALSSTRRPLHRRTTTSIVPIFKRTSGLTSGASSAETLTMLDKSILWVEVLGLEGTNRH